MAAHEEDMLKLGSALTKLSAAVESTCRYKSSSAEAKDAELLAFATQHDPSLLQHFSGLRVLARCDARHGAVLICNDSGDEALLEDVGCTAKLDRHAWRDDSRTKCAYTVSPRQLCVD